ncbi:MAG: hypothetical protein ACRDI2_09650 [Chloroflexota bacterium]
MPAFVAGQNSRQALWPDGGPAAALPLRVASGGTYVQRYADERRVCRVCEMRLRADEWARRRVGAPFAQRFTGTFSADGRTITGRWALAEDGEHWTTDSHVVYTRVT